MYHPFGCGLLPGFIWSPSEAPRPLPRQGDFNDQDSEHCFDIYGQGFF